MATKLDLHEAKKIWDYFQRFAEYSDLKELYAKCIPPLAKFEQKLIDYQNDYIRIENIITDFDKHMLQKANKVQFEEFQAQVMETFVRMEDQDKFT